MTYIIGKDRIFYKDTIIVDFKHRLTQVPFPDLLSTKTNSRQPYRSNGALAAFTR